MQLRVVRFRVEVLGFRTEHIAVVTTLLDETKYPDDAIAQLYLSRWQVELNLRDLKTAMGMDILRTQTPAMIEKELYVHAIALQRRARLAHRDRSAARCAARSIVL